MTPLFILVEESAVGFDCGSDDLFNDKSEALNAREEALRDAERNGVPVSYRLFELTEVTR